MISRPVGTLGASGVGALFTKAGLKAKTAQSKALELAEEIIFNERKQLSSIAMAHGLFNEEEAFNVAVKPNWEKARLCSDESIQIEGDLYATPDVIVEGECVIDIKCPYSIRTYKSNIENPNKGYVAQVQTQMMATGVDMGYLLYYLTSTKIDGFGNKEEYDIPIERRVTCIPIQRDEEFCKEVLHRSDELFKMRDTLVSHLMKAEYLDDVAFFNIHDTHKVTRLQDKSNLLTWEDKIIKNGGRHYVIEQID